MRAWLAILTGAVAALIWGQSRPPEIPFRKHVVDLGASETCAFADLNGDQRLDIISGEFWYEAPDWKPQRFREILFTNNYVDNFSDLPLDVDGDGRTDIISVSWFRRRITWHRNPGPAGGSWPETVIDSGFPVEFAILADLDNDGGARELLPQFGQEQAPLVWYSLRGGAFVRHLAFPTSMGHGIGAGDVNRDGRTDILTPRGWLEAPPDPRSGPWTFHPHFNLGATGFLHVLDVNEDGRPDIVGSMAHDYGIFWLERREDGSWRKHVIDDSWSQAHALTLADLNGDGRPELITGKRYMAHNGRDPGEREPLGVYWYEYRPTEAGIQWIRHIVDYSTRTGGGMQIPVADLDGDGDPDFAVAGKSGLFVFENLSKAPGGTPSGR
ncbi:MAG: VCBS repeat-containing protein [Bryobacterales bacterium]|nr:VCBS repeat-containing protein [Bryobacteraceae bacterium]MDW8355774.1 VCBS repeat-containing protein [Bryobacterales bacterium]